MRNKGIIGSIAALTEVYSFFGILKAHFPDWRQSYAKRSKLSAPVETPIYISSFTHVVEPLLTRTRHKLRPSKGDLKGRLKQCHLTSRITPIESNKGANQLIANLGAHLGVMEPNYGFNLTLAVWAWAGERSLRFVCSLSRLKTLIEGRARVRKWWLKTNNYIVINNGFWKRRGPDLASQWNLDPAFCSRSEKYEIFSGQLFWRSFDLWRNSNLMACYATQEFAE